MLLTWFLILLTPFVTSSVLLNSFDYVHSLPSVYWQTKVLHILKKKLHRIFSLALISPNMQFILQHAYVSLSILFIDFPQENATE